MRRPQYLFNKKDWFSVDRNQRASLEKEITELNADYLLNMPTEDLAQHFESKYRIDVPVLLVSEIVTDQKETQIDVSHDPYRINLDPSRPHYIKGTMVEISVPFSGDGDVFHIQPTAFTSHLPEGVVENCLLVLRMEGTNLMVEKVRGEIDRTIAEIQNYLTTLRANAGGLNTQLRSLARTQIERRREKLLADRSLVASLGFKIKERKGESNTYTAPSVRRKITPSSPPPSKKPFKPEPALAASDYEHILNVIQNMAQVMERSPSAFKTMNEEDLRFHFLVQLNGHYEGQATGETFNYQGKTDILVRSGDKNIFIAECKYWGGDKKLIETIDQLLGYSSWRDTKVAIVIFNRNKELSKVLDAIPDAVRSHPNYKRDVERMSETSFRYVFSHRDDQSREMIVTILAFDIPK